MENYNKNPSTKVNVSNNPNNANNNSNIKDFDSNDILIGLEFKLTAGKKLGSGKSNEIYLGRFIN